LWFSGWKDYVHDGWVAVAGPIAQAKTWLLAQGGGAMGSWCCDRSGPLAREVRRVEGASSQACATLQSRRREFGKRFDAPLPERLESGKRFIPNRVRFAQRSGAAARDRGGRRPPFHVK
jgi:hypothetical protein